MDHPKKLHTDPEPENREENSNSDNNSWDLPSSDSSDAKTGHADPADENAHADKLLDMSETVEAEASSGGNTQRYPSRVRYPPDYFSL